MFDKDKEYGNRIDAAFLLGEPFVLLGARKTGETITTDLGPADVAELLVQRMDSAGRAVGAEFTCSTIASAIIGKIEDAEDADFPAVVELRRVESAKYRTRALVLQFVSDYHPGA